MLRPLLLSLLHVSVSFSFICRSWSRVFPPEKINHQDLFLYPPTASASTAATSATATAASAAASFPKPASTKSPKTRREQLRSSSEGIEIEVEKVVDRQQERRVHQQRQRRRRREEKNAQLEAAIALLAGSSNPLNLLLNRNMNRAMNANHMNITPGFDALESWRRDQFKQWVNVEAIRARYRVDWLATVPRCIDPVLTTSISRKPGSEARGMRKRRQVESFYAVIAESGCAPPGSTVVDFGCGTGHLLLCLAALMPDRRFVGVDANGRSIQLLAHRAAEAGLSNVETAAGLIEEYEGECDVALALHVCGAATDAVLQVAEAREAAFIVAPCCIGKLQEGGMSSMNQMRRDVSLAADAAEKKQLGAATDTPLRSEGNSKGEDKGEVKSRLLLSPSPVPLPREPSSFFLERPRSRWMRDMVSTPTYMDMARSADFSSGEAMRSDLSSGDSGGDSGGDSNGETGGESSGDSRGESSGDSSGVAGTLPQGTLPQGRIPALCKAAVELDRCSALLESSPAYAVRLMKLLHLDAGLRDDVLVGFPQRQGDLLAGRVC